MLTLPFLAGHTFSLPGTRCEMQMQWVSLTHLVAYETAQFPVRRPMHHKRGSGPNWDHNAPAIGKTSEVAFRHKMHCFPLDVNARVEWHSATDEADLSLSTAMAGICYSRMITSPGRSTAASHLEVLGHFVLPGPCPIEDVNHLH